MSQPVAEFSRSRERSRALHEAIAQILSRRQAGESVTDAQAIAEHPELMPQLAEELAALQLVQMAYASAKEAGPIIELKSDSQFGGRGRGLLSAPMPPPKIDGYEILGEISAGGQGTVFKARQLSTGQIVAIKVIPGGTLLGTRQRARFEREVTILASLNHPNIVGIIDRGNTADGSLYLVMAYIDGEGLDQFIERWPRNAPGDIDRMVRLFVEIAQAVQSAHESGVVHRDLKPPNVRIDPAGRPHVLDFGLARLADQAISEQSRLDPLTLTGQIIGSLPWASPEQVSGAGDTLTARSDVYSLGVMLYQGLTGRFPYSVDGTIRQILDAITRTTPLPPSHLLPARMIDRTLDSVALKALAKDPMQRYASAGALAADLLAYLKDEPVSALPPMLKPRRRTNWRWIVAAIVVLSCIGGGVAYRILTRPKAPYVIPLPTLTNSIGMKLVRIPAGMFNMGSPRMEVGRDSSEEWRPVRIERPFFIGVTEVTEEQYCSVMGGLPSGKSAGKSLPAHGISWEQANEFCRRLSAKEHQTYRLPTEAEWEYACRAGALGAFAGTGKLDQMGWYAENSDGEVHPVAGKFPNSWGLYDMHGNVAEWCAERFLPTSTTTLPTDDGNSMWREYHVLRGGSVIRSSANCRSAARSTAQIPSSDNGLRVVLPQDGQ